MDNDIAIQNTSAMSFNGICPSITLAVIAQQWNTKASFTLFRYIYNGGSDGVSSEHFQESESL